MLPDGRETKADFFIFDKDLLFSIFISKIIYHCVSWVAIYLYMTDKPLILLASARKQGDTRKLVDVIFADTDHKLIDLLDFQISPYNYLHQYPDSDDFLKVTDEILNHRIIVFATPVYWYAMSGILKIFFDRFTDLITFQKQSGWRLKGKSFFLLAVGSDEKLPNGFEIPFQLTSDYFHMAYKGSIYFSTKELKSTNEIDSLKKLFLDKIKTGKDLD